MRFSICTAAIWLTLVQLSSCKGSASSGDEPGAGSEKSKDVNKTTSVEPNPSPKPDTTPNTTPPPSTDGKVTCPKHPLIFLHGFMGGKRIGGFVGVQKHFQDLGCKVGVTEVTAVNGIETRSKQLVPQIQKFMQTFGADKVNIIAHSQGGLDARYAISKLDFGKSVASLSTLSTPHHGTAVADVAIGATSDPSLKKMSQIMLTLFANFVNTQGGKDSDTAASLKSLSTAYLKNEFNPQVPDVAGVYYQSWGARTGSGTPDPTKMMLALSQGILKLKSGDNDGMVPASSSKWGEFRGVLDADHLDLVGLKLEDSKSPFNHLKFLDTLVTELSAKGF